MVSAVYAENSNIDPYSYNQVRNLQPVLQENFLPPVLAMKQSDPLTNSAPTSPAIVTDESGNKFLYQDGKLQAKIDEQGNQTFFSNGKASHEKNYEGALTKTYEYHGAKATVKNEWGEVTGYQQYGQGGLLLEEYDEDGNLAKTRMYNDRNLEWILDHNDGSKVKFNRDNPESEVNFEGHTTAYYITNGRHIQKRVEKTVDENGTVMDGDVTVYDEKGNKPLYKQDYQGNKVLVYNYGAYNRLESTTDQYSNVTEYQTDRQIAIKNYAGAEFKTWKWQGTRLISSEDKVNHESISLEAGVVTYYKNNKPIESRFGSGKYDKIVKRWVYEEGKLIAEWQASGNGIEPNKVLLYDHQRQGITFNWDGGTPSETELKEWAKSKQVVSVDGVVRGLWDSSNNSLIVFDLGGRVTKVLEQDHIPAREELFNLL